MKIKFKLIAEPNEFVDKELWKVVETERVPLNKENDQIVSASVLVGYLNNAQTSMLFLEKIRERTVFKVGDSFSTILDDSDLLGDLYFLKSIKVCHAESCIEEEVLSYEKVSLGDDFIQFSSSDSLILANLLSGVLIIINGELSTIDEYVFFNIDSLCIEGVIFSKEQFPKTKEFIESYLDNPFLFRLLKDMEKEIAIKRPDIEKIQFGIGFSVTQLADPPKPNTLPVPQNITIYKLLFNTAPELWEEVKYLSEEYGDINIVLECDTGSFKFSFKEFEDEDEDENCESCEETSHVLDILCNVAKSDFFYLYKKTCDGSHVDYLVSEEGDLVVATIPDLVDLDKDCEVVRYKKKDISKIIDISLGRFGCKICLVTEEASYAFSRDAFEEFILAYES